MSLNRRLLLLDGEVAPFGRHEDHDAIDCGSRVAAALLARNERLAERVGLIVAASARAWRSDGVGNGLAQLVGERIGLPRTPGVEVHAFCASANTAVRQACVAIEAGTVDVALVVGLEHMLGKGSGGSGPLVPEAAAAEGAHGYSPPVFYALCADRYLHETGAPREALAQVSVRNREHGAANPLARYRAPVTGEEVLGSRMIAEPLTMLQCCPPADGAGALLLAAADAIEGQPPHAVEIVGLGAGSGDRERVCLTSFAEDVTSSRIAYEMAGIEPKDVDVAEIHDAFTISQVLHLEDVGLQPRGEGWRHALEERPHLVVNPSGGLLSRGHPLGATGIAQFDAIRRYLTNERVELGYRRFGLVQEAGGLRSLGQVLSEVAVMARIGA